jgi:hypothetical protein
MCEDNERKYLIYSRLSSGGRYYRCDFIDGKYGRIVRTMTKRKATRYTAAGQLLIVD